MYVIEKIKNEIAKVLNKSFNLGIVESDLVYPPKIEMGDISLPCFKGSVKPGTEIPKELIKIKWIKGVNWTGPYLNFSLDKDFLFKELSRNIIKLKDDYGRNKSGKRKKVMIEYSNVNTHKEYHVGHVRNICYGDAMNRIILTNGYEAIPVSYINDFGIHVAKTLWAFEEFYKEEDLSENKGHFLGKVYVRATQEMKKNPASKDLVAFMMKKIESRSGREYELWKTTRQWSIDSFGKIYKELGIEFKEIFYESEFIEKGKEMVDNLLEKGVLEKSEGAIIANLEKENLGVLVVVRSDGTALYPVADLPLAIHKLDKYKLSESIIVVDVRQSLYFKQLFKVLEKVGRKEDMRHLGYEFVKLPEGMMSSRTGNTITYEDLKDQLLDKFRKETKQRHENWDNEKIEKVAKKLTNGAMKFEMLKVKADQIITFDIEKASRFDGFTAAYLQYVYARVQSILRKTDYDIMSFQKDQSISLSSRPERSEAEGSLDEESELILKLVKYSEIIEQAGKNYDPSIVAKYLFELGQIFNDYYHKISILKTEDEQQKKARLILLINIRQILKNGLELLGVEIMEEM